MLFHGHVYLRFGRCGDPQHFVVYANQSEFKNAKENLDDTKVYTKKCHISIIDGQLDNLTHQNIFYTVMSVSISFTLFVFNLVNSAEH